MTDNSWGRTAFLRIGALASVVPLLVLALLGSDHNTLNPGQAAVTPVNISVIASSAKVSTLSLSAALSNS